MSHQKLRKNKTCLNCSHYVSEQFCPHCGQENTETRQSFYYLFRHFAEDLVHYDGKFWQTIKYLLFSPGKLTNEYLAGKRKTYVAPVKLYIFISFITFLIPALLPDFHKENQKEQSQEINKIKSNAFQNTDENLHIDILKNDISLFGLKNVHSINELDSIQKKLPKEKKLSFLKYASFKKILQKKEDYSNMQKKDLKEKFSEEFIHNLPKVLFIYLPFFAFSLWLFHGKKKWYYFNHGIFTLHYFSFILLTALLFIIIDWFFYNFFKTYAISDAINDCIIFIFFFYPIFYFFRSHRMVYKESKAISSLKSFLIFFGNQIIILFILVFYIIYIALSVH